MAKIYSYEEYRLRKLIKELQIDLSHKLEYCEKNGYLWIDHYTIKNISDSINHLMDQLERLKNERPS